MRLSMLPRTIGFSLAREILLYSFIGFMAITLILLSQNALRHLEQLVRVGFEWRDMAVALRALSVMFMAYALPLAFLLGALFAIRRMKSDAELLAMQSCGLGVGALLGATLSLGVAVSGLTAFLVIDAEHVARRDMRSLLMNVGARGNIIEPGRFQYIGDRVVFVGERYRGNRLRTIMIASPSDAEPFSYVIFADRGTFDFDGERKVLRVQLDGGDVHIDSERGDAGRDKRISFERLDYEIDIRHLIAQAYTPTRPKQMSLAELRAVGEKADRGEELSALDEKRPSWYAFEFHRRLALPLAPIIFAVLAVALGASGRRSSRALALVLGVGLAFTYYAALSFGGLLSERGWLPAWAVVWGVSGGFALTAGWSLRRTWKTLGL